MTDSFLTLKQIESLIWEVTARMLGLDPALPANQSKVRKSWPTTGAPAWKVNEDIVFFRVGDEDDPFNIIRENVYTEHDEDNANQANVYTRVLTVHWSCYGPNSFDNAFLIRNNLYKTTIRDLLNNKQVFLIPEIKSPVRCPEEYAGQWWERTNVHARFNELINFNQTVPYFKSATVGITDQNDNNVVVNINK